MILVGRGEVAWLGKRVLIRVGTFGAVLKGGFSGKWKGREGLVWSGMGWGGTANWLRGFRYLGVSCACAVRSGSTGLSFTYPHSVVNWHAFSFLLN